jgi:hypothetical protein
MWTGNTKSIERNYDLLKNEKLLTRFERASDGLIVSGGEKCRPQGCNRLGLADIVDWPVDERDGFDFRDVNAVVNAFHYRSLLAMADMAGALGKTEDAAYLAARRPRLSAAEESADETEREPRVNTETPPETSIKAFFIPFAIPEPDPIPSIEPIIANANISSAARSIPPETNFETMERVIPSPDEATDEA